MCLLSPAGNFFPKSYSFFFYPIANFPMCLAYSTPFPCDDFEVPVNPSWIYVNSPFNSFPAHVSFSCSEVPCSHDSPRADGGFVPSSGFFCVLVPFPGAFRFILPWDFFLKFFSPIFFERDPPPPLRPLFVDYDVGLKEEATPFTPPPYPWFLGLFCLLRVPPSSNPLVDKFAYLITCFLAPHYLIPNSNENVVHKKANPRSLSAVIREAGDPCGYPTVVTIITSIPVSSLKCPQFPLLMPFPPENPPMKMQFPPHLHP